MIGGNLLDLLVGMTTVAAISPCSFCKEIPSIHVFFVVHLLVCDKNDQFTNLKRKLPVGNSLKRLDIA